MIYFADSDSGVIGLIPKSGVPDGGAPRILASGLPGPLRVVADDTSIYFTVQGPALVRDGGYADYTNGSLMKCPKTSLRRSLRGPWHCFWAAAAGTE